MSFEPHRRDDDPRPIGASRPEFTLELSYLPHLEEGNGMPWGGVVKCNGVIIGSGAMATRDEVVEAAKALALTFEATEDKIPSVETIEL